MNLFQILQKVLKEWNEISHLDFCLLTPDLEVYISTTDRRLPSIQKMQNFLSDDFMVSLANSSLHLFKIYSGETLTYLLIVWGGGTSAHTIGELAVCQISSLIEAHREKTDKNIFMQNLLLGNYSQMDAFNRAKKTSYLHHLPACSLPHRNQAGAGRGSYHNGEKHFLRQDKRFHHFRQ